MKAILCTHFGTPDTLELADIAEPQAGPGEAVVRVRAAALNFFDTLIIAGKYQHKPPFPFSPAAEFAGVVESIGAGVANLAPGDRVMGYMGWGAAREAVAVPAQQLVKLPDGLDFERAAGLTVTYGTTLYALRERASLKSGETLLVLGASGGTGLATIELGKMMGARVIACASSSEKLAFAREHGADELINYATEDFRAALKRLGGEHGIDVVYDPVGGAYAEPAVRSLAWEGRYLVLGFAAGEIPKLPLNLVLLERLRYSRRVLGRLDQTRAASATRADERHRALVRRRPDQRPRARRLPAGRHRDRTGSHRRPARHGQGRAAAVTPRTISHNHAFDGAWSSATPLWRRSRSGGGAGYLVHGGGERDIALGQAAGIVGRQHDLDGLVDIEPFGMVIELFRHQRGPRHEAEGLVEIRKDEFFADGVAVLGFAPALEPRQRLLPGFAREFLTHVAAPVQNR